jgi:hypothetical protein
VAAGEEVAMPAQDGVGVDQQPQFSQRGLLQPVQ